MVSRILETEVVSPAGFSDLQCGINMPVVKL